MGTQAAGAAGTAGAADLTTAVRYLTTTTGANGVAGGTSLAADGYYESFADFGDFGLTLDGAFALAATRGDDPVLAKVVAFVGGHGTDGSGRTVDAWTGIGTPYASGGSLAKEALLAEVVGADPHAFGGHDLVAALDATLCTATATKTGCAAAGNYAYATSTFSQALGVIAQLRAGVGAAAPLAYLESLQHTDGSFPSLIPGTGDEDVDSTAVAAMALELVAADPAASAAAKATAATAMTSAVAFIAGAQLADGGWQGTAGLSTTTAALAIQGLTLAGSTYAPQLLRARAFLAGQQNADGGFAVSADPGSPRTSDVRASTQVVGGLVGTSFGRLADHGGGSAPAPVPTATPTRRPAPGPSTARVLVTASATPSAPVTAAAGPSLPATGQDVLGLSAVGTGLVLGGAALILTARRRRVRR